MVALLPPNPKHAGPGAAPPLSGPTTTAPSLTVMTELPPTPAECTLLIANEIGTPLMDPRRSTLIWQSRTEPTSVVVPHCSPSDPE